MKCILKKPKIIEFNKKPESITYLYLNLGIKDYNNNINFNKNKIITKSKHFYKLLLYNLELYTKNYLEEANKHQKIIYDRNNIKVILNILDYKPINYKILFYNCDNTHKYILNYTKIKINNNKIYGWDNNFSIKLFNIFKNIN